MNILWGGTPQQAYSQAGTVKNNPENHFSPPETCVLVFSWQKTDNKQANKSTIYSVRW